MCPRRVVEVDDDRLRPGVYDQERSCVSRDKHPRPAQSFDFEEAAQVASSVEPLYFPADGDPILKAHPDHVLTNHRG